MKKSEKQHVMLAVLFTSSDISLTFDGRGGLQKVTDVGMDGGKLSSQFNCTTHLFIPRPNCDVTLYPNLCSLDDSVVGLGHPRGKIILGH